MLMSSIFARKFKAMIKGPVILACSPCETIIEIIKCEVDRITVPVLVSFATSGALDFDGFYGRCHFSNSPFRSAKCWCEKLDFLQAKSGNLHFYLSKETRTRARVEKSPKIPLVTANPPVIMDTVG